MENQKETEILSGTIIFQKINDGSKSESLQPFLYISQTEVIHLYVKNSNPFENNELQKYDGKFVNVKGLYKEKDFIIEEISVV